MLSPDQLLALNVLEEAGDQPDDGKAAIAQVVLNRMARRFMSDGTVAGTILAKDQFSWAWFDMIAGKYQRVCSTAQQAVDRTQRLYDAAQLAALSHCAIIAAQVVAGTYPGRRLPEDVVSYCNPRVLTKTPNWAIPSKLVCSIGHHDFYRA